MFLQGGIRLHYVIETLPNDIIGIIKGYISSNIHDYINIYIAEVVDELLRGKYPIEEALELYFNTYISKQETECFIHICDSYYDKVKFFSQCYQITERQLIEAILFYHTFELEMGK